MGDMSKSRFVLIFAIVAVVVFVVGLLIGNFAIKKKEENEETDIQSVSLELTSSCGEAVKNHRSAMAAAVEEQCESYSCKPKLPVTYVINHLRGRTVTFDGEMDEPAWFDADWTAEFTDIRGPSYPKPYHATNVKMVWDDSALYVGAVLRESDIWANMTKHDANLWEENCFEVFFDADWTMHTYKEFQINALGTILDLIMSKPYANGGDNNRTWSIPGLQVGLHLEGTINDSTDTDKYWSVELAFPFSDLKNGYPSDTSASFPPSPGQYWRMIFGRPQHYFNKTTSGGYVPSGKPNEWWSWSDQQAAAFHIPERFGIVEFRNDTDVTTDFTTPPFWSSYSALVDLYEAEHAFKSVIGGFTDDVKLLQRYMSPLARAKECIDTVSIELTGTGFNASVTSSNGQYWGWITEDRYTRLSR